MRLTRYRFGDFELDPASRELWRNGERVPLPPKSFECLAYLVAHRERAVGRDELIAAVWGRVDVTDTVVSQTLLRARKALDDTGERQAMVRTVPRFGYQWVAPVEEGVRASESPSADVPLPSGFDASVANGVPRTSRWRRWPVLTALAAALLLGLGLLAWLQPWHKPEAGRTDANLVLVLPVTVTPADPEDAWVRLGAMDYIASRLRRGGLKVLPSDQTLHIGGQVRDPAQLEEGDWRRLKEASAAHWVLAPEADHDRNGWRVRLRLYESGKPRLIDAHGATPLAAASAATDSWLRRLGRAAVDERTPSPLTERVQQIDAELVAGQLAIVRRLIEQAPSAQRADPRLKVREAQLEYRAGRMDEATRLFASVLDAQRLDDGTRALAMMGLGAVDIRRQEFGRAEKHYTQALTLLESDTASIDDPSLLGNAYNGRGVALVERRRMADAVRDMGQARIAMQRAGNLVEAAMVDSNLGIIETRRGHYPQALKEFDRAIEVYQRFEVNDYMAATLASKAATQLKMAQPAQALDTARRADALIRSAEDSALATMAVGVLARAQLATGKLGEARASIERLRGLGLPTDSKLLAELTIWLEMSKGNFAKAEALAKRLPPAGERVSDPLALAAIQAALTQRDTATAKAWLSRLPDESADESGHVRPVAQALIAHADGDRAQAVALTSEAVRQAETSGTPDDRVRAGVVRALVLLDEQPDTAAAVLGDLDTFVDSDYRVAWAMWRLYGALGDEAMTERLRAQAAALKGERDLSRVPVL